MKPPVTSNAQTDDVSKPITQSIVQNLIRSPCFFVIICTILSTITNLMNAIYTINHKDILRTVIVYAPMGHTFYVSTTEEVYRYRIQRILFLQNCIIHLSV